MFVLLLFVGCCYGYLCWVCVIYFVFEFACWLCCFYFARLLLGDLVLGVFF